MEMEMTKLTNEAVIAQIEALVAAAKASLPAQATDEQAREAAIAAGLKGQFYTRARSAAHAAKARCGENAEAGVDFQTYEVADRCFGFILLPMDGENLDERYDDVFGNPLATGAVESFEATEEELAAQQGRPAREPEPVAAGDDDLNIPAFLRRGFETKDEADAKVAEAREFIARDNVQVSKLVDLRSDGAEPATKAKKAPKAVRPDGLKEGSAFAKMVDLVVRPEGVTYQELLDATGWKDCRPMFKKGCETANVEVRTEKIEGTRSVRYFGTYRKG